MRHEEAHAVDDGPGVAAHRGAILIEVVVAEHGSHGRKRLQIVDDLGAADVTRMDDMLAISECIECLNRQNAMRIGNHADSSHATPRFLSPLAPQSILV